MTIQMKKRGRISLAVCAVLVLGLLATPALAGEITGNGKWIAGSPDAPLNGKSVCAYSGREDDPNSGEFRNSKAQSWGLIEKAIRDFLTLIGLAPGDSCNPSKQ